MKTYLEYLALGMLTVGAVGLASIIVYAVVQVMRGKTL